VRERKREGETVVLEDGKCWVGERECVVLCCIGEYMKRDHTMKEGNRERSTWRLTQGSLPAVMTGFLFLFFYV